MVTREREKKCWRYLRIILGIFTQIGMKTIWYIKNGKGELYEFKGN